jgi:hypothetical protein
VATMNQKKQDYYKEWRDVDPNWYLLGLVLFTVMACIFALSRISSLH